MPKLIVQGQAMDCQVVVFDKDGTLIDGYGVLRSLVQSRMQVLERHFGPELVPLYARFCGYDPLTEQVDPLGPLAVAPCREEELVLATLLYQNGFTWPQAREQAARIFAEANAEIDITRGLKPLPFVRETLTALKQAGFHLALATGDGHDRAERMMRHLGWRELFELIVGVDQVERPKPAPDLVLHCAASFDVPAGEIVSIGDSCLDAEMGRRAGVRATIAVATGATSRETLAACADHVIDHLGDLGIAA